MNKKNCLLRLKQLNGEKKWMWPQVQRTCGGFESRKPETIMVGKNIWKLQQEWHGSVHFAYQHCTVETEEMRTKFRASLSYIG